MLERFLLLWLTLLSGAAYWWVTWFPCAGDPFEASYPYRAQIFAVTMLAIGSLLPREEVRAVFRRWPTVLGGTTLQYISMPLLAYGCAWLFGLPDELFVGVIVVGCVPGAMASNVLTLAARGNVSYSVSLTTSATLFSPLVVPFALWITLHQWVPLDPVKVGVKLAWMVVVPVLVGYLLSQRWRLWQDLAQRFAAMVANLTILWIIAMVVGVHRDQVGRISTPLLLALLCVNGLGYVAGTLGSLVMRLPRPMRRALTLEIGMQNAGLGTLLAMDLFGKESASAIPPAIYTFGCMFTGTILARLWAEFGSARAPAVAEQSAES